MRDLKDYQDKYQKLAYERYQGMFRKRKVIEILSKYPHNHTIEVGCGLHSIMDEIKNFNKLSIVEPGEIFYSKALHERTNLANKENIDIYNEYFESWLPPKGYSTADFIVISGLIHEVEDDSLILKKAFELADKNTVIHISVPNAKSFHRLLALEMGLIKDIYAPSENQKEFQRNRIFDIETLAKLAESFGFKVIEQGTYSFKPFTHKQMEDMMQAGLLTEQMVEGFYKMGKYLPDIGSEAFVNIKKK